MIRFYVSAGVAALAVSLVSVFAPIEAEIAFAQQAGQPVTVQHTQPPADEIVPQFVAKAIVQPIPLETEPAETKSEKAGSLRELISLHGNGTLDEQLKCLAGAVYFEARGEPLAGQLAVAEVVINRAASGRFPASYCGVVLQKSQFSFVKRGRMPSLPGDSATWQRAKAIAQIAHRGLWDSEAEGSLYFHAHYVSPSWSNRRQAMARISNHVFYR
jgi:spore germination cell wall hydrolase CwlJ-like protein